MESQRKRTWRRWAAATLGAMMVLVGVGFATMSLVSLSGGASGSIAATAGAAPAASPGGPEDRTLYLTVPEIGLKDVAVHDSASEEKLEESAIHLPGTGFPWQAGANTYIAGHRLGTLGTGSFLIFFELNELERGDEINLSDSTGREYDYRVTETLVVGPGEVEVTEPVPGKSVVSLQTCTLPDFSRRIVVRAELMA